MRKKLIAGFLCCLLLAVLPCAVFADNDTAGGAQSLAGGIVAFRLEQDGASTVQEWIDGALTDGAGRTSEWWVIALSQSGETYDFTRYAAALDAYLAENAVRSPVERQRCALAFAASGWTGHPFVADALSGTVGEQGIMSWVYGLHFAANGLDCGHSSDEIIGRLLELRLEDGGWAVSGDESDVDVTAMVLQALAPFRGEERVDAALADGLELLSARQTAAGGFRSYGVENAESTAQVLIALAALEIDPETDSRFLKDAPATEALASFRMEDGGFRHIPEGEYSAVATVQAYCAAVALLRMEEGRGPFFTLDAEPAENLPAPVYTPGGPGSGEGAPTDGNAPEDGSSGEKSSGWAGWVLGGCALLACGVLIILRKKKAALLCAALTLAFVLLALLTGCGSSVPPEDAAGCAVITVRCDTVAGKSEDLPADGCILPETEVAFAEGETVFDLLLRAAKDARIPVDSLNTGGTAYVSGIYSLYEFDYGGSSGWIFRVNGETPSQSCDSVPLKDGDRVEWLYTCDMGNDLG